MSNRNRGQSNLEYVILVAGIVLVFAAILRPGGSYNRRLESSLDEASSIMETVAGRAKKITGGGGQTDSDEGGD